MEYPGLSLRALEKEEATKNIVHKFGERQGKRGKIENRKIKRGQGKVGEAKTISLFK